VAGNGQAAAALEVLQTAHTHALTLGKSLLSQPRHAPQASQQRAETLFVGSRGTFNLGGGG
jgi:hypothetical protein